jgi:hypothetical protein
MPALRKVGTYREGNVRIYGAPEAGDKRHLEHMNMRGCALKSSNVCDIFQVAALSIIPDLKPHTSTRSKPISFRISSAVLSESSISASLAPNGSAADAAASSAAAASSTAALYPSGSVNWTALERRETPLASDGIARSDQFR